MASINMNELEHLKIPLEDIISATKNFDVAYHIGYGELCRVYKGELLLSEGLTIVALMRLDRVYGREWGPEIFPEIMMLSRNRHENILSLLGFCYEEGEMILVYEYYASGGSLEEHLSSPDLSWNQRLRICIGAARGLQQRHYPGDGILQRVFHGEINSGAILLDRNWNAKVANFYKSGPVGTPGFVDRPSMNTYHLTKGSFVYEFGAVLFEVLCGRSYFESHGGGPDLSWNQRLRICIGAARGLQQRHYPGDGILQRVFQGEINSGAILLDRNWNAKVANFYKSGPVGTPGFVDRPSMNTYHLTKGSFVYEFGAVLFEVLCGRSYFESHGGGDREERPSIALVLKELEIALELQIGKFYSEFLHLQIPLPLIVTATSNFAAENLIKEDSFGKDYKGKMLRSGHMTDIVARSENGEKIIVYEHAAHGSLDRHLTNATLTWFRRLQICIGVARALSHVHYDVIHCDINSSKIFLDKDWEAKLSGFELSTKYPETWKHRLLFSHHFDNSGNIDPVYLKNATVTPKYDVYSFGVVLFEVLCGRKATIGDSGVDQSLAEMAKRHFEERKLDEIIVQGLRKQMDLESLAIFSNTAYNCLKEHVKRPTMDQVVKDLEEALEHQWKRDNIEQSAAADKDLSSNRLKVNSSFSLR
ncbi:protein kinase-like domain-containing protein [Artemisia annua]|uniref:Protein kinase-like domain-containing protein n=1 Tax=Artemisia annua TaxID=35608 RepID=A0A2U1PUB7_ARTAN|nr:protein kinase-like domain-containing protein [Artemisia annua]